jgi:sphinganine-1-phosphate aldolase
MNLPEQGLTADEILARLDVMRADDVPTHGGKTYAYVYDSGLDGLDELAARAHRLFQSANGLDPTVFPSIATLENSVVGMVAGLLGGSADTAGTVTSGGTESCILAVKTAREHWVSTHPGGGRPSMVLPETAHPAFHKGAYLLGVDVVTVPVDPTTFRVRPDAVAAAIDERTAMVVVSAPSYAHGVIDPVAEVAALAEQHGVLCHVDACIGGMLLPYLRRLGVPLPPVGMDVPGVTSLSVDLHKYAYATKGTSVLLFRDAQLRRHSYYAFAGWPGYPVVNSTLQSTKSAGPLAAAWAVLHSVGDEGYLELARRTRTATEQIASGVDSIEGLRVLVPPDSSLVSVVGDDDVDVLVVADEMRERGWYVQPQLAFKDMPRNIHLTVTAASLDRVEPLLRDLAASVAAARDLPPAAVDPELAVLAGSLDPDTLTPEQMDAVLQAAGFAGGSALPTRMAPVLALLEALPTALQERLLQEVIGRVFTAVPSVGFEPTLDGV